MGGVSKQRWLVQMFYCLLMYMCLGCWLQKKPGFFFVSGVTYMSVSAVQEVLCQGECGISWSLLTLWPYLNSLSSQQTKINWMPLDIQWKLVLQWPCWLPLTRAGRIVLLSFYRHSFSSSCWKLILSHGEGTCSCAGGGAIVFSTFGGLTSKQILEKN